MILNNISIYWWLIFSYIALTLFFVTVLIDIAAIFSLRLHVKLNIIFFQTYILKLRFSLVIMATLKYDYKYSKYYNKLNMWLIISNNFNLIVFILPSCLGLATIQLVELLKDHVKDLIIIMLWSVLDIDKFIMHNKILSALAIKIIYHVYMDESRDIPVVYTNVFIYIYIYILS